MIWAIPINKKHGFGYTRDRDTSIPALTEPWDSYAKENSAVPATPEFAIPYKAVARLGTEIIKQAKKAIGSTNIFDQKLFSDWVSDLADRITNGLPPNEVRRPGPSFEVASFPAIVNAGWFVYLFRLPQLRQTMPESKPDALKGRFYGLVSKGIEAAELQTRWHEIKERLENGGH